jgi:hypothetical protein
VRRVVYVVRFFWLVAPLPPLMAPAMAAVGVATALLAVADPGRTSAVLTPLLLLQMFAASSGFLVPARRGHYDLLLTGGFSRAGIALAQWGVSVLPGAAIYLAVASVVFLLGGNESGSLRGPGPVLALALVSTVPWAATVALPRFTGAIAWLLAIATVAAVLDGDASRLLVPLDRDPLPGVSTMFLMLNPVALAGIDRTPLSAGILLPVLLLVAGSMLAATIWLARQDIALEAPQ